MRNSVCGAVVACVLLAGCAPQVQYVTVQPECSPPPQPALPAIQGDELAVLPDEVYWRLEDRERLLVDWAFEMRAMLGALCETAAE